MLSREDNELLTRVGPGAAMGSLLRCFWQPFGLASELPRADSDPLRVRRVTQFLMPTYTMIPVPVGAPVSFTAATPMDDQTMMGFTVTWHPDRPLRDDEIGQIESWLGVHTEVDPLTFKPLRNKDNDYLIDRGFQRSGRSYTGIRGIREEDLAVQESMGSVCDRTIEHLGSSDLAVIALRRRLLDAVRALSEHGEVPYEAHRADAYRVRSAALVLPREVAWDVGAADALVATA